MNTIVFRFPNIEDAYKASQIYEDRLEALLEDGVPESQVVFKLADDYALFPKTDVARLEELQSYPMFKYPLLPEFKTDTQQYKFLEKCLVETIIGERRLKLEDLFYSETIPPRDIEYPEYVELNSRKASVLRHTAENYAEQEKADYLTYRCSFNGDTGKRVWSSYRAYKQEKNVLLTKLVQLRCMEFLGGHNSTILRRLARHPMWRSKWISATKTGAPIFRGVITEWNINQTLLSYWSNFYDSIYASYEPPENFIVDRDDLLDAWLESKETESKRNSTKETDDGEFRATFTKHKVLPVKKR